MYMDFYVGFLFGMVGMFALLKVLELVKQEDKKEIEYEEVKPHVIHEERLHPVTITATVDVPYEVLEHHNDEYLKKTITSKLKLKLMDKIWEFVKVEKVDDQKQFMYRYYATMLALLPERQAIKAEMEKEKF